MAIAVARQNFRGVPQAVVGNMRLTVTDVTHDTSYAAGGDPVTAKQLGLAYVDRAHAQIKAVGGTINAVNPVPLVQTDGSVKVQLFDETPAEVTGDLSNIVSRVWAYGR